MRRLKDRGFSLIELMVVVAIMGVLASIAIPSYLKWVRKARTSEALMNTRKLFDGSVAYFGSPYSDASGGLLQPQFPVDEALTPTAIPSGIEVVTTDWWGSQTWIALSFGVNDPHRYSYQYNSTGTGNDAQFTASAFGDLSGDDLYSTFVRFGSIRQLEVVGSSALYVSRQLE